jgi:hypothetical protein
VFKFNWNLNTLKSNSFIFYFINNGTTRLNSGSSHHDYPLRFFLLIIAPVAAPTPHQLHPFAILQLNLFFCVVVVVVDVVLFPG